MKLNGLAVNKDVVEMKVLLVNIDSKIPNFALAKIEKFHKNRGDEILYDMPLLKDHADKIYVSCVFTKNKNLCYEWQSDKTIIGGTGWDIKSRLPDEVENVKPRINWGFTTRGCIRKCEFCVVPAKEGKLHIVGDIYDIWDGKSKDITIMDNNILGKPNHFRKICGQIRKEKIRVDFNQGLDIKLLNDKLIEELKTIRHKEYHFAWDGKEDLSDKFRWLYSHLKRCTIYVLCGFDSTFKQDLTKLNILKSIGHNGYVMRYETVYNDKKYILLARWVNQHKMFHTHSWEEYLKVTSSGKRKKDKISIDLI